MPAQIQHQHELDTCGLKCPLPILRLKKTLAQLPAGHIVLVKATDPNAPADFAEFCRQTGHVLLQHIEKDHIFFFYVQRRPDASDRVTACFV